MLLEKQSKRVHKPFESQAAERMCGVLYDCDPTDRGRAVQIDAKDARDHRRTCIALTEQSEPATKARASSPIP